jgi:peptide/nickel transport system substrate-binding protein
VHPGRRGGKAEEETTVRGEGKYWRTIDRRRFLTVTSAGAVAAFIAACGGGKKTESGAAGAGAGTSVTAAPPQFMINASLQEISNIDPAVGHDATNSTAQKNVYDALFRHNKVPPETEPWLVEGYETPDGITWTFKLKGNARFHDGSPVTAEAVKFSFDRLMRVNKGVSWMFSGQLDPSGVTTPDSRTVVMKLEKPYAPLLHALTWLFILNPAVVKANDKGDDATAWLTDHEAGSGPFTIKRWQPGELYEFDAVPDYWNGWLPEGRLSGYQHRIVREPATRRLLIEQGEVDITAVTPTDTIALQSSPDLEVPLVPGIGTYCVRLNNQRGPTADVNVRRALSYAHDYDAVVKLAFNGLAVRLEGPLSPNLRGAAKGLPFYTTDLTKAKAELAKSPYAGGFELFFGYVVGVDQERVHAEIVQANFAPLNIKVTPQAMPWPDAVARFRNVDSSPASFPVFSGTDFPDPDNFLYAWYHSSQAGTWSAASHYKNPELDRLLEQGRQTLDWPRRESLYKQAQEILVRDAVDIFGVSSYGGGVYRKWLKGVQQLGIMGGNGYRDYYIVGRPSRR